MVRKQIVFAGLLLASIAGCCVLSARAANDGVKIYYIRHAQTMGNVTHDYSDKNQCTFSDLGKKQIAGVAEKLVPYTFDYIAVSPTWRTRQTILPYMQANDRIGYIWPEIEEGGCDLRGKDVPAVNLPKGKPVEIAPENAAYYKIRDEDSTFCYAPTDNAESLGVFQRGVDMLKEQFGGTGQSVLLVCHSCTGSRYFELLLGIKPKGRFAPQNASVTLLEDSGDGVFELVQFNDEPFEQYYYWTQPKANQQSAEQQNVTLALKGQYFGPASDKEYRVKWVLRDAGGDVVQQNTKTFKLEENTEDTLTTIDISTKGIVAGDEYRLDSKLYRGEELILEWDMPFVIPDYYELDGKWLIRRGDNPKRSAPGYDDSHWHEIDVPGAWEDDVFPDYDGMAWYRHYFTVPQEWLEKWGDKPLAIMLGAIDDADISYLNGEKIGQSGEFSPEKKTAYDTIRIYSITRDVLNQNGENVLAVQVDDWMGAGGICKGPVAIGPEKTLRRVAGNRK